MATYCWTAMILGIVISFVVLIVAVQATSTHSAQVSVAKVVTAFLMLFLSLGLVKLALGYGSLSKNNESSEKAADRALQAKPDELGAFKVLYDYHLHRAAGPLLPTWLWQMREKELNQTWQEHRCGTATP